MVNKLSVAVLAVLLTVSMALAGVSNNISSAFARESESGSNGGEGSNTKDNSPKDSKSNSDTGSGDSPSGDTGSNDNNKIVEAKPAEPSGLTPVENPKPNPEEQKICMIPEGCGNGIKSGDPVQDNPAPVKGPDNDCLFHPELDKCKSDNGKCPDGFFQNEDENCVPNHQKCPKHFHSHEDDETGRCIPDKVPCEKGFIRNPDFPTCSSKASVCRDHPTITECSQNININIIIHRHGSSGSTSMSKNCFDAIKIAWLTKIHRGQNHEVDQFIDKCLNIKS